MRNQPWKKGDRVGPIVSSLYNGDIDIGGTPATVTVARAKMARLVYPALPLR